MGDDRSIRFAAQKCENYVCGMSRIMGCRVLRGVCVAVCPNGKRDLEIPEEHVEHPC